MHEYSLVDGLLAQIDALRVEHQADRVTAVRLIVGEFSGIEAQLLHTAFDELSQGTPMEGATLEIQSSELLARCKDCRAEFHVGGFQFVCPHCQSGSVDIEKGEELILDTLTFVDEGAS